MAPAGRAYPLKTWIAKLRVVHLGLLPLAEPISWFDPHTMSSGIGSGVAPA